MTIITHESVFEFCRTYDWQKRLDALEEMLLDERWSFTDAKEGAKNTKNPILENYIKHTFKRLYQLAAIDETRYVSTCTDRMCFNLGLFTKEYERVYFVCRKETRADDDKEWSFAGFEKESSPALYDFAELPEKVGFFDKVEDLIYDINCPLRVNSAHILSNPDNVARLPEDLQNSKNLQILFEGAIQLAIKKVEANYKVAVPQYFNGNIQFLLPLSLQEIEKVDIVMAVSKINGFYRGNTCLTLDMAYNNARLIAKPESTWLLSATGET